MKFTNKRGNQAQKEGGMIMANGYRTFQDVKSEAQRQANKHGGPVNIYKIGRSRSKRSKVLYALAGRYGVGRPILTVRPE